MQANRFSKLIAALDDGTEADVYAVRAMAVFQEQFREDSHLDCHVAVACER